MARSPDGRTPAIARPARLGGRPPVRRPQSRPRALGRDSARPPLTRKGASLRPPLQPLLTSDSRFRSFRLLRRDLNRVSDFLKPCPRDRGWLHRPRRRSRARGGSRWRVAPSVAHLRKTAPSREPRSACLCDGEGRNRTGDTTIFSRVLYQLSYLAGCRVAARAKASDRRAERLIALGDATDSCARRLRASASSRRSLVSGGSRADPATPPAIPGHAGRRSSGTALIGDGRASARSTPTATSSTFAPGPAGAALVADPAELQAAGTVPADSGIVARALGAGRRIPFWRADSVRQSYLPGTNVLRTVARFGAALAGRRPPARRDRIGRRRQALAGRVPPARAAVRRAGRGGCTGARCSCSGH